jgi:hypothetical protein
MERQVDVYCLNITAHKAYTNMCSSVAAMRRAKWKLFGTPEALFVLTSRTNKIIVKLAHMIAAIDTDEKRSLWQELHNLCCWMSDYWAMSAKTGGKHDEDNRVA